MILKHKTTSAMVKKFLSVIENRIAKNNNHKVWEKRELKSTL